LVNPLAMGSSASTFQELAETKKKVVITTSVKQACQWLAAGVIVKDVVTSRHQVSILDNSNDNKDSNKACEVYFVIDRHAFNHDQHQHQVILDLSTTVHCQPEKFELFLEQLKSVGYPRLNRVCWGEALRLRLCEIPKTEFATEIFPTITGCGGVVNQASDLQPQSH